MDLYNYFFYLYKKIYTRLIRRNFIQLQAYIDPRVEIINPQHMDIRKANIKPYTFIYAIKGDLLESNKFKPLIIINNGCIISRFCQITCSNNLVFEENVFLSEGVLITDSIHDYSDVHIAIKDQELISQGPIIIGEGSWIGNGSKIIGKVKIGKNCVIGSNTFLNKNVPDYSVVVGSPARIVKQFNKINGNWENVNILLEELDINI